MNIWVCLSCGYAYDPMTGDEEADVMPGTAFENLSDEWRCPLCGAKKDSFQEQTK